MRAVTALVIATLCLIPREPLHAQVTRPRTGARTPPRETVRKVPLGPQPDVTGWSPHTDRLLPGQEIRIEGRDFQGGITVRIGEQRIAIVRVTPSLVVARAPHPGDTAFPYVSGPLTVAHPAGQRRILHPNVRIVDPWNSFTPRVVSVTRAAEPFWGPNNEKIIQPFRIVLADVPGDRLVGLVPDPEASWCDVQPVGVPNGNEPFADHRIEKTIQIWYEPPGRTYAQKCRFVVSVRTRYADDPDDVRTSSVELGYIDVVHPAAKPTKTFRVTSTAELAQYFHFTPPTALNAVGTCTGDSFGTPVGVVTVVGDMALRIRSGPLGTTCPYALTKIGNPRNRISLHKLKDEWTVDGLEWKESTTGTHCGVSRDGSARDARVMKLRFGRGVLFMGWKTVPGIEIEEHVTAQVFLTCSPTPLNDNEVVARLDAIVIRGPAGATDWRDAFR